MEENCRKIIEQFAISGDLESLAPFKIGHINETYISSWRAGDTVTRYIHQKVNRFVFKDVPNLMKNVVRVTDHIRSKHQTSPLSRARCTLKLVPTKSGEYFICDSASDFWRSYEYIEKSVSYNVCPNKALAFEGARVCGTFLRDLSDFDPHLLYETISKFHDTPNRYLLLEQAIAADPIRRALEVKAELDFVMERRKFAALVVERMASGRIPIRATHYDLKFNNVLFDVDSLQGLCVVDLDTCMPGSALYDFGDLVRSASVAAAEDETDLSRVSIDEELFEALVKGYIQGTAGLLCADELELMAYAARLIALELGIRFLTDYIMGDTYFRVHHPGHNLDRCRTQFKIVADIESKEQRLNEIVKRSVI